jgi:hypothetical protein
VLQSQEGEEVAVLHGVESLVQVVLVAVELVLITMMLLQQEQQILAVVAVQQKLL